MPLMKTLKFPGSSEVYVVYDGAAIHSINGQLPDENGNINLDIGAGGGQEQAAVVADLEKAVGQAADEATNTPASGLFAEIERINQELGKKVEQTEDGRLMTNAEGEKIAALLSIYKHSDEFTVTEDNELQIAEIKAEKIIGLKEALAGALTPENLEKLYNPVKFEIANTPVDTLVDYTDYEIRVMVPKDTRWVFQQSGANADPNVYYIALKAYAPKGAVSFKEDLAEIIADNTMYSFENNDFAGVDGYGRKYSIVWLPVARYDASAGVWTYYGANSNKEKYIGWHYSVEWYAANGTKIGADTIRINLSNEDCHNNPQPYFMGGVIKELYLNGEKMEVVDNRVNLSMTGTVVSGDEIVVNEDGTLSIKQIDATKLVTSEESSIILNGGSASV